MQFSDRVGATTPSKVLLVNSISPALQNSLWNYLLKSLFGDDWDRHKRVVDVIAERFFKFPVDQLPSRSLVRDWFRNSFFYHKDTRWWQIYNFLEFAVADSGCFGSPKYAIAEINKVLQQEMSGYRFINGVLAPISNEHEMAAIGEAFAKAKSAGLQGVQAHLETAIGLLSQKPNPDYRNSIKESISAVESLTKQIAGEKSGGLDKALGKLDEKVKFHGAFKAGLLSLYGYTSDEDGIRHAILEEPTVGFDEAKFMLISCSALINFIVGKAMTAGMLSEHQAQAPSQAARPRGAQL